MRRLLPGPPAELDDDTLAAAYALAPDTARHLRMNFVASADGAVTVAGKSAGLATPGDSRVFGLLREFCDVIMVGAGTVRVEGYLQPPYPAERRARRRARGLAEIPPYAVVSHALRLDASSPLFTAAAPRTIVVTCASAPAGALAELAEVAELVVAGSDRVDLAGALHQLAERGLGRVLCEGGPHLFAALLAADLVDELCLTVSPLLTGPGPGRINAGAPLATSLEPLQLGHALEEDGALFLRYQLARLPGPARPPHPSR